MNKNLLVLSLSIIGLANFAPIKPMDFTLTNNSHYPVSVVNNKTKKKQTLSQGQSTTVSSSATYSSFIWASNDHSSKQPYIQIGYKNGHGIFSYHAGTPVQGQQGLPTVFHLDMNNNATIILQDAATSSTINTCFGNITATIQG